MITPIILHITSRPEWEAAQAAGEYRAPSLENEGFIHLSTPEQVLGVANAFYRDQPDLVLLVVDSEAVDAPLRWEAPLEAPDSETRFPHIYGPLNLEAVIDVVDFPAGPEGSYTLPDAVQARANTE